MKDKELSRQIVRYIFDTAISTAQLNSSNSEEYIYHLRVLNLYLQEYLEKIKLPEDESWREKINTEIKIKL